MPDAFDPYYKWLGIPAAEQPPNYYRLLGLMLFEADPEVIESAADRQMAHVRSFQGGKHAAESQKLLNDLSAAKLCLLSANKKTAYDQTLKAKLASAQTGTQAPAGPSQMKTAPKPVATPIKPLRVAQAATLPRPMPVQTSPDNSLGFDPLAASAAPRHRKRKPASQQPALLIGAAAAVIAVIGLLWALSGGDGDPPVKISAKAASPAEQLPEGTDEAATRKRPVHQASRSKNVDRPAADKLEPDRARPGDSDDDSTGEPRDNARAAADDVMDPVLPDDTDDTGVNSAGPSSAEPNDVPAKAAVPDADALKAAIAEIQSLLKADFSATKKPDQRIALAEKLLGLAKDSDELNARYALLSEAQRLAASAADSALAMQAIDALAEEFAVDRLDLAADMLDGVGNKELPVTARNELVELVMPLVDEAATAGQFKLARRLAAVGLAVARKASATDAAKTLARQTHELAAQEKLAEAADAARKQLAEKPDDADAHLTLGKYLCLVVGDWDAGLPHLKQGSDAALRSIAERELDGAEATADQVALGDQWWDLADEQKGVEKDRYRARAGYWYEQAIAELTGLSKAKVEKRLAELPRLPPAAPFGKATAAKVYYLSDLNAEEVRIFAGEPMRGKYELKIDGVASPHAILTHPTGGRAHAAFQLPKGCRAFLGKVGVSNYIDPSRVVGPLIFRVAADGKEVWRSRPFQSSKDAAQDFDISLRNASKLELIVDCGGHDNYSHGVWFEPRVTTAGVSNGKSLSGENGQLATGKWIDLLSLADPARQHLEPAWQRTAAGLHVEKRETPLPMPMSVAGEYSLHVEFTRNTGRDAVVVILPLGSGQCMLALSGFDGATSGFEVINGQELRASQASIKPGTLENGHRYSLDVTVHCTGSKCTIETKLDGKPYVKWSGEITSLWLTPGWVIPRRDVIALAANEPTDFHAAKFKLLSGTAVLDANAAPQGNVSNVASAKNSPSNKATSDLMHGAVLVATFDEPTIIHKNGEMRVRDVSGKQKPGLVVGAGFVPGKSGQALALRKPGQHIAWGNDPSLNPPKFTFFAWLKPTSHDNVLRDVFSKHSEDRGRTGLVVRLDADRPKFGIGIGDGNWHFLEQGMSVPLEQWTHLAVTHDDNTSSIYINSQLAKSAASDGLVAASIERCLMGSTPGHDELQFYGLIDELALFDRALSAAEVQQIYQLGVKGKSLTSAGKK